MQKDINLHVFAWALAVVISSNYVCGCVESEKQVLLHFKRSVIDKDKWLESWAGDNCCSWLGISCNIDGHVIQLDSEGFSLKGLIPESIGNLTFLTSLSLTWNDFQGLIPNSIGNLASLSTLHLSGNHLNGSLPESLCQLSKLEMLDVSYNQLTGSIPKCIGGLSNLRVLDLFSNSWEGLISEQHFANLTSLTTLLISSKSKLVFNVNPEWVPTFQLQNLYMESIKVGLEFPSWLLTQRNIHAIRMRNTSISDTIPSVWFVSLLSRAYVVDLSNNDINVPRPSSIPAPNNMSSLALSNNHLSSKFPAYICNFTSLASLVLSYNNISGELPRCIGNLTQLQKVDLMKNSLSGDIPDLWGSLRHLSYLSLHNNKFQGKLPQSIQNLTDLRVFDVGYNNLTDILPTWMGEQLPGITYLVLRDNHFYGSIPKQFCNYSSLQVLNLAGNHITGNLPLCFNNLTAMTTTEISQNPMSLYYGETLIDNAKGYELEYTSTLEYLFSINLSNNNISGEIPEELVDLRNLLNLNLASNNLSGKIPDRIWKMEQLEYLDLSRNKLSGPIPQSLSELKHLIRLNLSFNDLSGRIPTGNQLQVLENLSSIYTGNNQLCGQPTLKLCAGDPEPHEGHDNKKAGSDSDSNSDDEHVWIYAGIGPGLLVGFLGFCASLHFIKSWRYSYFHFVEEVFDKITLVFVLSWKKFYN